MRTSDLRPGRSVVVAADSCVGYAGPTGTVGKRRLPRGTRCLVVSVRRLDNDLTQFRALIAGAPVLCFFRVLRDPTHMFKIE